MNIFVLSEDVKETAQWHLDKHCVKMPLETAQMLCTVLQQNSVLNVPYKPVHRKHPCTLWVAESQNNFLWLCKLGIALCDEYTYRYGKIHKCREVIEFCSNHFNVLPDIPITKFVQAMPDEYKRSNPIEGYREYYRKGKNHIAVWTKREVPYWYSTYTFGQAS
jgi:hypothetical protein